MSTWFMDGPFWGSVTSKNFLIDSKTEIWKGQQKVSEAAVNSSSDHATSHSQHGASENIYIYIYFFFKRKLQYVILSLV